METTPYNGNLVLKHLDREQFIGDQENDRPSVIVPEEEKRDRIQNLRGFYEIVEVADDGELATELDEGDVVMVENRVVDELYEKPHIEEQLFFVNEKRVIAKVDK